MGLKLTIGVGDKIVIAKAGIVIDILTTSDLQTRLEFTAPPEMEINAVFKDSSKMFKNKRKD